MPRLTLAALLAAATALVAGEAYTWKNVYTGAGGGWIGNVIFNPSKKGLAYLRTDIGGAYKLAADGNSWIPLLDFADNARFNYWGVESIATDPVDPNNVYIEVGLYTNFWDPNNGTILKSSDQGATFQAIPLPFKVGGNMPGRGPGERLVIDPNNNKVLYLGARSGNGLWRSTDAGLTWSRVTSLTATGNFVTDPSDSSGYNSDPLGVGWIVFDTTGPKTAAGTSRIFVGVLAKGSPSIWVSNDAGATWSAVAGQDTTYLTHRGILAPAEKSLYITYVDTAGPFDGSAGALKKYNITSGTFSDITPAEAKADGNYGFGGVTIDAQKPGVVMAVSLNKYYPDGQIWRSLDGGSNWTNFYNYSYPGPDYHLAVTPHYKWDVSSAPWISTYVTDTKRIGWGIEGLQIDPFDSNHFLYGTGLTLFGSHDLLNWDTKGNITLSSLSTGIEETSIRGLVSPPTGAHLVSAAADIGGWVHTDLDNPPSKVILPITLEDIDYAGLAPSKLVVIGDNANSLSTSSDGGATWSTYPGSTPTGGKITYTANGTSIVWTGGSGVSVSKNGGAFVASKGVPAGAVVEADKANDAYVYASYGGKVYVSSDSGATFTQTLVLGSATASRAIAVNTLGRAGELWISTDRGLWHSVDFGKTVVGLSGVTSAYSVAAGAPATTGGIPVLFTAGIVGGASGIWKSENGGTVWTQINDAKHGFASLTDAVLAADPRIYKRIYIGTNGRGVWYGN